MKLRHTIAAAGPIVACLLCVNTSLALAQQAASGGNVVGAQTGGHPASLASVTPEEAEKHRISLWERRLAQLATREHAALFFDLPEDIFPPKVDASRPYGVDAMKALAASADRTWRQLHGVQAFARDDTLRHMQANQKAMYEWLESMDQKAFDDLTHGRLFLSQLDDTSADLVRELCAYEPSLSFKTLDSPDETKDSRTNKCSNSYFVSRLGTIV